MAQYALILDKIPLRECMARGYRRHRRVHVIEHSGHTFASDVECTVPGWGTVPVWPIEELLARTDYPPAQAQRIRKLNRYGKPEADSCVAFVPR